MAAISDNPSGAIFAETAFRGILHRKNNGTIILADNFFVFRPDGSEDDANSVVLPWLRIVKHQVSPASHPKSLLKVVINQDANNLQGHGKPPSPSALTFVFPTRSDLEIARRDITSRLSRVKGTAFSNGKKRSRDALGDGQNDGQPKKKPTTPPSSHFVKLDPVALVATRASLLASDPALRAQHRLLVVDGGTLSEEDFWETHHRLVADEYAKISGKVKPGMSSDIKSSLDLGLASSGGKKGDKKGSGGGARGIVRLGVEEMRQIFIMYPAVHRAYEEKVPLELSEEQFWRKYLESEYFHRDRGRIGAHIGRVNERERMEKERFGKAGGSKGEKGEKTAGGGAGDGDAKKEDKKGEGPEDGMGDDEAKSRLAAAGTDDIFSRYGRGNLTTGAGATDPVTSRHNRAIGTQIAVGQFDLAATAETERGERFLEGLDLHPPPEGDSRGARVIDKYNRHWAIVLHPNESTAGVDLSTVARRSAIEGVTVDDDDAKVNGGCDREMRRLVGFADASEIDADHSRGVGDDAEDESGNPFTELTLKNIGAYSGKFTSGGKGSRLGQNPQMHMKYAKYLAAAMRASTEPLLRDENTGKAKGFGEAQCLRQALPDPKIGRGLLEALTKKMAADSQTEADVQRLADTLEEEFRTKLASFFRRSSELLRHFFSLRSVFSDDSDGNSGGGGGRSEGEKNRLSNIVKGMEKVHGEMEAMRRNLPQMESKMCLPIMDQLDWAFKLHREDSSGTGGGFVTVAKGGFVPVAQF